MAQFDTFNLPAIHLASQRAQANRLALNSEKQRQNFITSESNRLAAARHAYGAAMAGDAQAGAFLASLDPELHMSTVKLKAGMAEDQRKRYDHAHLLMARAALGAETPEQLASAREQLTQQFPEQAENFAQLTWENRDVLGLAAADIAAISGEAKYTEFKPVPGTEGEVLAQYNRRTGEASKPIEARPTTGRASSSERKFTSGDAKAIRSAIASFWGDKIKQHPITGEIQVLDPETAREINQMSALAQEIFLSAGGAISHDEAARRAYNQTYNRTPGDTDAQVDYIFTPTGMVPNANR